MKNRSHLSVVAFLCVGVVCAALTIVPSVRQTNEQISIENGFVKAGFTQDSLFYMSEFYGDFKGTGDYGVNLLSNKGFRLERENEDGSFSSPTIGRAEYNKAQVTQTGNCSFIRFPYVLDDSELPVVQEQWSFSLCAGDRSLRFYSTGQVVAADTSFKFRTVSHSLYANPLSTTSFFDQGVVQIMSAQPKNTAFGSVDRMHRAFVLGGTGAIDVLRPQATGGEYDQVVLLNAVPGEAAYTSGFREILLGTFTERDVWCAGSSEADVQVHTNIDFTIQLHHLLTLFFFCLLNSDCC